jgi:hypothetical protein
MNRLTSLIFAALLSLPLAALHAAEVTDLRCEYLKDPLGMDALRPRLSWKLETGNLKPERGIKQTCYQILVASSEKLLKEGRRICGIAGRWRVIRAFRWNTRESRLNSGCSVSGKSVSGICRLTSDL